MTKRLETVCSHLTRARVFADIGCDHGYCTQYMFAHDLCGKAYISDISAHSLEKAAALMQDEVKAGRCIPVVANGMEGIKEPCDLVLIAGMGGEEIVKILEKVPLPEKFVLQPMKNSEKVRRFLVERGARIECDYTFEDGNFYDMIVGCGTGGDEYTDHEYRHGRDNLKSPSPAFVHKLKHDINNYRTALSSSVFQGARRDEVRRKLHELEGILDAITGNI